MPKHCYHSCTETQHLFSSAKCTMRRKVEPFLNPKLSEEELLKKLLRRMSEQWWHIMPVHGFSDKTVDLDHKYCYSLFCLLLQWKCPSVTLQLLLPGKYRYIYESQSKVSPSGEMFWSFRTSILFYALIWTNNLNNSDIFKTWTFWSPAEILLLC